MEVHCHGGHAATTAIVADLNSAGIITRSWPETLDAGKLEADAFEALAHAPTERTAAILLDQYRGALRAAINRVIEFINGGHLEQAGSELERILSREPVGQHLVAPWRVVLAGKPNVGKSSLINRLAGYQRSIVFDQPGTTRDVVTTRTAIDGWPVELADTAGLRSGDDEIERRPIIPPPPMSSLRRPSRPALPASP